MKISRSGMNVFMIKQIFRLQTSGKYSMHIEQEKYADGILVIDAKVYIDGVEVKP